MFGSEYPFDTTGFESTFVLAEDGLKAAVFERDDSPFAEGIPYEKAVQFMESQHKCNIACRGYLEPSYFWLWKRLSWKQHTLYAQLHVADGWMLNSSPCIVLREGTMGDAPLRIWIVA